MGKRRRAREAALKLLYALEVTHGAGQEVLASSWAEDTIPEGGREFTTALVIGVLERRDEIDALIREWSAHWALDRIGLVERNILRFAIYELLFMPDIPPNVTINEAVEIAKRYGAHDASPFINGVLDRIKHEVMDRSEDMLPTS